MFLTPGSRATKSPITNHNNLNRQKIVRTDIYAPPFDAMSCTGLQINGCFEVSQDIGSTLTTLSNTSTRQIMDCWSATYSHVAATAVIKVQQIAPPTSSAMSAVFPSCVQISSTTALSAPAAGDFFLLQQAIEGYRWTRLGYGNAVAQSIAVGFWVYATVPGVATFCLRNSAQNRSYVSNFTINNATTWEYKTITVPGDTSGTWLQTSGVGVYMGFCFVSGSTYQAANNAWSAGSFIATSGTGNFLGTASNVVAVTGVTVFPGTEAPSAARSPITMRSFDSELSLAGRYYWRSTGAYPSIAGSTFANTAVYGIPISHPIVMRATPSITIVGTWAVSGCGQPTATQVTERGFTLQVSGTSATNVAANPDGSTTYLTADARL